MPSGTVLAQWDGGVPHGNTPTNLGWMGHLSEPLGLLL